MEEFTGCMTGDVQWTSIRELLWTQDWVRTLEGGMVQCHEGCSGAVHWIYVGGNAVDVHWNTAMDGIL